jgi:hypothetical protein
MQARLIKAGAIAPMPPLVKVTGHGRKLQGGLPPEPYRTSRDIGNANKQQSPAKVSLKHINMRSVMEGYTASMQAGRRRA